METNKFDFTDEQVEQMRNSIALYAEPDQVDAAHTVASLLSGESDEPENMYIAMLFHFSQKQNAKELIDIINTLSGKEVE